MRNHGRHGRLWTRDELHAIERGMSRGDSFARIAGRLSGRTAQGVHHAVRRARKNGLLPAATSYRARNVHADNLWVKEDVDLLRDLFHEHGSRWDVIARFFPRRSPNAVRRKTQRMGLERKSAPNNGPLFDAAVVTESPPTSPLTLSDNSPGRKMLQATLWCPDCGKAMNVTIQEGA